MITATPAIYETLAKIVLPENILDIFEVTSIEDENTHVIDETGTEVHVIHIYLDERDIHGLLRMTRNSRTATLSRYLCLAYCEVC